METSYTERVIYWIDAHHYSQQHWQTVAAEYLAQEEGQVDLAILRLAEALKSFHHQFQDAVVKPGNVLYEFIDLALDKVDWIAVAQSRYQSDTLTTSDSV